MMKGIKGGILLAAMLLLSLVTKAEINNGLSIDWLCAKANVVVKGVVTNSKIQPSTSPMEFSVDILEILKGDKHLKNRNALVFKTYTLPTNLLYQSDTILLFLNADTLATGGFSLFNNNYRAISDNYRYSVIDLKHNQQPVITAEFKVLARWTEILAYVKKVIPNYKEGVNYIIIDVVVPADTEAFKHLYAGSSCFVGMPKIIIESDPRPKKPVDRN